MKRLIAMALFVALVPGAGHLCNAQEPSSSASQQKQEQTKYTKEQFEAMKKQNEETAKHNALVKQLNDAFTAKNWEAALAPLQQLIAANPDQWQYYSGLGTARLNLGQYDQAIDAYAKGVQAAERSTSGDSKNASPDLARTKIGEATMLTNQGNAFLKLRKNKEAIAAYTKAASLDPNPATAYFNLCATQYNIGNTVGALDACDKAIAADPNKADTYFIKGSLMMSEANADKEGRITLPPGTAEALNKYLELAPDGPHADDVKTMLKSIGAKIETTYKKKGK
ncbi:MAG: tetratricopeptide repeat protein [Acidobacteriia bacterium]|nr:tetratricopeptide repeat protein [Terriglobia bacterium]